MLFVHASLDGLFFSPEELEVAQGLCGGLTTFVSPMNDLNSLDLCGSVSLILPISQIGAQWFAEVLKVFEL